MFRNKMECRKFIEILASVSLMVLNICVAVVKKQKGLLYILMWTQYIREPFRYFKPGRRSMIQMNCKFQNCFFTAQVDYFSDVTDYDVILFNAPSLVSDISLPSMRSDKQIYVFVSTESASNYPLTEQFDNFFNYTWSYKLNSDIPYPYFVVRRKRNGKVIAPQTRVKWKSHKNMKLTPKSVIEQLQNKSIGAAWFVSNCNTRSSRLNYATELQRHFKKLGHKIDIFGNCKASKICPRNITDECLNLVKNNYYFYLSFENSFSEDYVTEKVVTAVNNYAVPVVFGGADYSRFLPDGAYVNARLYTPEALAIKMNEMIRNRQEYYDYFKFYRYYTYHAIDESEDIHPLCTFCEFINDESIWDARRTYARFRNWWTTNGMQDTLAPDTMRNNKNSG